MDHIHTIPVLDALRDPQGCAFCVMMANLEKSAIQFMMGPSYMEDDVRMQTNKIGFCKHHMDAMYKHQNRLGLALMLHTHMQQINKDVANIINKRLPAPFFGKDPGGVVTRLKNHLLTTHDGCYVCRKVENTFAKYMDTFFHLWSRGGEEALLIAGQKGYCLPHFIQMLTKSEGLGRSKREAFLDQILPIWQQFTSEMEEDLSWFIQKFDHRNSDAPWKNSKDALPRAMALLGGDGA